MTVKVSISLTDQQHAFAKSLVDAGTYSNLSAVLQQGVNLFKQKAEAEAAERNAFLGMIEERRKGPFISGEELGRRMEIGMAERRKLHGIQD